MRNDKWEIVFSACLLLLLIETARAQYCNPAAVSLIVHDEKGAALTEADLKTVAAALPEYIGDAAVRETGASQKRIHRTGRRGTEDAEKTIRTGRNY